MLSSHKLSSEIWWPVENDVFSGDLLCCVKGVTESQLVQKRQGFIALRCRFHKECSPEKFCLNILPKKVDFGYEIISRLLMKIISQKYEEFDTFLQENSALLPIVKYSDIIHVSDEYSPFCLLQDNYLDRNASLKPGKIYTFCVGQRRFSFKDFIARVMGLNFDISSYIGNELPVAIQYENNILWKGEIQKEHEEKV